MTRRRREGFPLALALTLSTAALAVPRLGDPLPPAPWKSGSSELVVLYSHDCGDLSSLWGVLLEQNIPLRVVNAEDVPADAPGVLEVWRGAGATAFSRALKLRRYPTVVYVQDGHVTDFWEGVKNDPAQRTNLLKFLGSLEVK